MARIKIDLPDSFIFQTEIKVRSSDLNYGGHVGNDSILTLIQEARILFYQSMGFEGEVRIHGNVGQIIADAAVVYQSESFYGDELIIAIAIADISKYGFDMFYRITNKTTSKNVAVAKTGIVCFDYQQRKIAPVPAVLLEKLK